MTWTDKSPAKYEFKNADGQILDNISPSEMYKYYRGPMAQMSRVQAQQESQGGSKVVDVDEE